MEYKSLALSNIIHIEQVLFKIIYVYSYIHLTTIKKNKWSLKFLLPKYEDPSLIPRTRLKKATEDCPPHSTRLELVAVVSDKFTDGSP